MSNYIYYNGELYHYGVPGMKWGKRKEYYKQKAKQYRDASTFVSNKTLQKYYNKKADKYDATAESLHTAKGRAVDTAKRVGRSALAFGIAAAGTVIVAKYLNRPFRQAVANAGKNEIGKAAVRGTMDRFGQTQLKGLGENFIRNKLGYGSIKL